MDSLATIDVGLDALRNSIDLKENFEQKKNKMTENSSSYVNNREKSSARSKENVCCTSSQTLPKATTKTIAAGATKKMQNFKTTFDSLSQKLRRSTRRRYRLDSGAKSPAPLLERPSPVKMYSPFCIDTPSKCTRSVSNLGTPGKYTPIRHAFNFDSPSQCFRKDVEALTKGTRHLNSMATGIALRSSFRK